MDTKELYKQIESMQRYRAGWYDAIVKDNIDIIVKQGFVSPKCYILEYENTKKVFKTTIFDLDPEELIDKTKNELLYKMLRNVQIHIANPIVAISMVSEGVFLKKGEEEPKAYLLISFENKIETVLNAYKVVKRREIGPNGEVLKIMSMVKDDNFANKRDNYEIEKFKHILRPNLFNKNDKAIYN